MAETCNAQVKWHPGCAGENSAPRDPGEVCFLSRKMQAGVYACSWLAKCPVNYFISAVPVAFKVILGHDLGLRAQSHPGQVACSKLVFSALSEGVN